MLIIIYINLCFKKDYDYSKRYIGNADYNYWRNKYNEKAEIFHKIECIKNNFTNFM